MPKLPQGVNRRKDGLLEKRFTVEGKRYSIYAHTVKELQEKELAKRQDLQSKSYKRNRSITMDEYFQEWIEQKNKNIKAASLYGYKLNYRNHVSSRLGGKKIVKIERREILQMMDQIKEESSTNMANYCLMLTKNILRYAVDDEIIERNPAESIRRIKDQKAAGTRAVDTYHRALTREEQSAFLRELDGQYYREFLELILLTGMRFGECAALSWADIDQAAEVIHVTKTQSRSASGSVIVSTTTKTSAGRRDIPMNGAIKTVLRRQRQKMLDLYGLPGVRPESAVFCSTEGTLLHCTTINNVIRDAVDRMNFKGIKADPFSVHALRDTFATRYIEAGGTPQTLKTILGHSSLAMTMDLYAHVLPDTKAEEMNRIAII